MKKSIIAAAALVALAACNKNVIEMTPAEAGYGYINLGITADTEMVVTKAEGDAQETPIYNDYYVTLNGPSTNWTKEFNKIADADWKVPAGDYTITVANYSDKASVYVANDGVGDKYIMGSGTVTVKAGVVTDCPVGCSVKNSKVSFAIDEKFGTVFTDPAVVVTDGTRSQTPTVGTSHVEANATYFEPAELTWTLTVTSNLNGKKTYAGKITTSAAKWTNVTFTTGNTSGQINVVITVDDQMTVETLTPIEVDPFGGTPVE